MKSRILEKLLALLLVTMGSILLVGGYALLRSGGSGWYICAGSVLVCVAVLVWRASPWSGRLYALFLVCTTAWSLWEVGLDAWALSARLDLLAAIGLTWLLPVMRQRTARIERFLSGTVSAIVLVGLVGLHVAAQWSANPPARSHSVVPGPAEQADTDWKYYGGDANGSRYSPLAQIQPGNVANLKLAWSYRTGDLAEAGQEYNFEATPLKVHNLVYACTPSGQVVALDAVNGNEKWHFNAGTDKTGLTTFNCRGVSYYQVTAVQSACGQRVYVTTPDNRLWSLDALTGQRCAAFGTDGSISLLQGLGDVRRGSYSVTSPPVIVAGRIVVGARVQDNVSTDMPSGVVRAFDAATGALTWVWDVGRGAADAARANAVAYTRSTPNAWAPMVVDEALGLLYIPTGNSAADFWGKHRRPFDEKYSAAVVAVDIVTGVTRWVFQTTHHDLWDNDVSAQPVLADWPGPLGPIPAVVVGTKQGNIFVLDRRTGEPIVPVTEVTAPGGSDVGETLSPSQPRSAIAVNPGPSLLTESRMWGLTPLDQMWCRLRYRKSRYEGPYTPPGVASPTLVYPGMFGGIEWGGIAVDPQRGILMANPSAMPFVLTMARVGRKAGVKGSASGKGPEGTVEGLVETAGTGYAASFFGFLSPLKVPCMQPPWGSLIAIDMKSQHVIWQRPVGTARDSGPFGLSAQLPVLIGTPQIGGTVITRGGLVFSAATLDRYLRAYDLATGRELWATRLPAGGQATPMTYEADGRQYVVIAAGGHSVLGTKAGDYLLAFALE